MAFPSWAFSANRFTALSKSYANQVLGTFTVLLGEKKTQIRYKSRAENLKQVQKQPDSIHYFVEDWEHFGVACGTSLMRQLKNSGSHWCVSSDILILLHWWQSLGHLRDFNFHWNHEEISHLLFQAEILIEKRYVLLYRLFSIKSKACLIDPTVKIVFQKNWKL